MLRYIYTQVVPLRLQKKTQTTKPDLDVALLLAGDRRQILTLPQLGSPRRLRDHRYYTKFSWQADSRHRARRRTLTHNAS